MAELLRREDPEAFQTLASLKVDYTNTGADYCDYKVQSKNHIINVDSEGQVCRINYNNATRDSVLNVPLGEVQLFYEALKSFVNIMSRPEHVLTYVMEPGHLVTFDNCRVLHGRRTYVNKGEKVRHLEGCYLDWDEAMSRLRILRESVSGDKP